MYFNFLSWEIPSPKSLGIVLLLDPVSSPEIHTFVTKESLSLQNLKILHVSYQFISCFFFPKRKKFPISAIFFFPALTIFYIPVTDFNIYY